MFSLKSFAAAMLGLYLAMRLGLPRPFWAPLTAYVVSQPLSGAVRSKAIYRVMGTIIGAAAAVLLVPRLVNYSLLLTLALSIWLGICLYISLLDRTPRAYVFMLAGYTASLIGLPALVDTSIFNAATMFDAALARVEEITIGIACATLIHSLIFPQSIGPLILKRMDKALEDAQEWTRQALLGTPPTQRSSDHRKLAQDITELRLMSTHLPFDTSNLRWTANIIRVLQDRLSLLVPLVSAVEERVRLLRAAGNYPSSLAWQKLLDNLAKWVQQGGDSSPDTAILLRRQLAETTPTADSQSSWEDLIKLNLATGLGRLIDACENCFHLRRQIEVGMNGAIPEESRKLSRIPTRELHTDRGLALMSAFAATMAVSMSCAFWIISGWPLGFAAPMMAALYCSFFATQDNPVPAIKATFKGTLYSTPFAGLYLLWLLPSVHSFEMLVLAFAPFLILFGILITRPTAAPIAVPLMLTTLATLTMIDMGASDMTSFINSQISQLIGVGAAVFFTSLLRSVNAEWIARRLLRAGWNEIAHLGQAIKAPPVIAITVRMVDRIALLAPRLAMAGAKMAPSAGNALIDLRIGLNMANLLRAQSHLQRNALSMQPLLQKLSDHFKNRLAYSSEQTHSLLAQIDDALHSLCVAPFFGRQQESIAALIGIRCDLFPTAPPYQPDTAIKKDAS